MLSDNTSAWKATKRGKHFIASTNKHLPITANGRQWTVTYKTTYHHGKNPMASGWDHQVQFESKTQ